MQTSVEIVSEGRMLICGIYVHDCCRQNGHKRNHRRHLFDMFRRHTRLDTRIGGVPSVDNFNLYTTFLHNL